MGEAAAMTRWMGGWNPNCGVFVTMRTSVALASPRSNQIETTLFVEGRTTTRNEHEKTFARRSSLGRIRGPRIRGRYRRAALCQGPGLYGAAGGLQLDRLLYRRPCRRGVWRRQQPVGQFRPLPRRRAGRLRLSIRRQLGVGRRGAIFLACEQ